MGHKTTHEENLTSLKRIEGQIRGIQKMIDQKEYCVDIVHQIYAAIKALYTVGEKILVKHIENCVVEAFEDKSEKDKSEKINEVMQLIKRINRLK